jgi:rubredoxin
MQFTYKIQIVTDKRNHYRKVKAASKVDAIEQIRDKCDKAAYPYREIKEADKRHNICDCGKLACFKYVDTDWLCPECHKQAAQASQ